jgi:hypothetical protein
MTVQEAHGSDGKCLILEQIYPKMQKNRKI